ncbi:MAG: DsrE/DsrF/DrsH-like family protein, partial [Acidobacteriota bacterium]|nr:DsrE/DsrF/DrsH-like family protein [Acidobacteriota bacterium]
MTEATLTAPVEAEVNQPQTMQKLSVICSKGSLDMAYPGLILANAARMSGIDASLFFTFWGLDIVVEKKIDHL